jgi:hypothetical protein
MKGDLLPTKTCFEDTARNMLRFQVEFPYSAVLAIHAICLQAEGRRYAHGWIEVGSLAVHCRMLDGERVCVVENAASYRRRLRVVEFKCYDFVQYRRLIAVSRNYGPWTKTYRELCIRAGLTKQVPAIEVEAVTA